MSAMPRSIGEDEEASAEDESGGFDADIHFANGIFLAGPTGVKPQTI